MLIQGVHIGIETTNLLHGPSYFCDVGLNMKLHHFDDEATP